MAQSHGPPARNFKIPAFATEPGRARLAGDERGREDGYLMPRLFQFGGEIVHYLLDAANGAEGLAYEQDTHENEDSGNGLHQRHGTLLPSGETSNRGPAGKPARVRAGAPIARAMHKGG